MLTAKTTIINQAGLHARAAYKLVELSSSFARDIQSGQSQMVDGKSSSSCRMLAAVKGTELSVVVDGADEEQALKSIIALIDDRFGESE